jgi:glycosyltransferase involved in cell wall biosynthesis
VAGMEDTIQNEKNGWLLEKNVPKNLAAIIEKVLSDEKKLKLISSAALKRADFFSEKKFYKDIVEFYEMLIKNYKF